MRQFLENICSESESTYSANDNFEHFIIDLEPIRGPTDPDLTEAQTFLNLLDPNAEKYSFQTFGDGSDKDQSLVRQFHTDFRSIREDLIELNRSRAGIFVAVQETDLKGRKAENIIQVRPRPEVPNSQLGSDPICSRAGAHCPCIIPLFRISNLDILKTKASFSN